MAKTVTPQKRRMNATKAADAEFSKRIRARDNGCKASLFRFECGGSLQCCHIISRRYRALRWDDDNAVAMCGAHHTYFTHHPLEWEDFCRDIGIDYDVLRHLALHAPAEKAQDALIRLRALSLSSKDER